MLSWVEHEKKFINQGPDSAVMHTDSLYLMYIQRYDFWCGSQDCCEQVISKEKAWVTYRCI